MDIPASARTRAASVKPADLEAVAHVLRRTGFGPFPGGVEAAAAQHSSIDGLIEARLAATPLPFVAPDGIDGIQDEEPQANEFFALQDAWIGRMTDDDAALHEKLMWFWHAHFTTSVSKSSTIYCWRQLRLLHKHALGNFAELTVEMCTDPAMLQWLDGSGSTNPNPNENYARELMELFTIGRGRYTEADVRAAAKAMAGWDAVPDQRAPFRNPAAVLTEPVEFMGVTAVHTPESIVGRILEREETALFVVAKLARFLIGPGVPDTEIATWAATFRGSGYEIRPVVTAMFTSDGFRSAARSRPKHGIEWLCAVLRAADLEIPPSWQVQEWGQFPYWPLNVAGWPDRWLSASSLYARTAFITSRAVGGPDFNDARDPVTAALHHCGLFDVAATSRNALSEVWEVHGQNSQELLRAALTVPEFAAA
ncbi:MAG TPA: DUF1800 family protein [Microthrixaceae bacterium]|nr:DUF1800 family protein [Microthrixaceae bacterium]HMT60754.1 DUF1800 family protein [Microthrixaceae bacterium]